MAVLLFSLSTNHDDRPICLNTMRCTLSLPLPLHNCITVDRVFNILGHKIDGNDESWKYMGQNTARDRLAPGAVAYPELVSRGVSKTRKFKWLVKVDASIYQTPDLK